MSGVAPRNAGGHWPLLLKEVRACTLCASHLPQGPRPVLQVDARARVLIAGQAPGSKVHASGVPFDDASGDRLRRWMGLDRQTFYDPQRVAILPMPHPSPRNNIWLKANPWFESDVVPALQARVLELIAPA